MCNLQWIKQLAYLGIVAIALCYGTWEVPACLATRIKIKIINDEAVYAVVAHYHECYLE